MLLPCFYRYPSFAPKAPKYPLKKRSSVPVVTASNNTMMAPPAMRSVAYDNETPQSPSQQPDSAKSPGESSFSPSNEQNALLSLTLNEIQLKRGKSLGSMNMDELLANLWSAADETRASSKQRSHTEPFDNNNPVANQPALARQGSFSIPMPLCKKTVDEVLYEITKEQSQALESNSNNCSQPPPQRQQTLGEMTLEDFLVKAGVIHGTPLSLQKKIEMAIQRSNAYVDASPRMGEVIGVGFAAQQSVGNNNFLAGGNGFVAYQMFPQSKGCVGEAANDHTKNEKDHAMVEMLAQHNKRRIIDGPLEVVVERRQRRMIKNRESAARSRARKQAYTVELELELNQLKEENAMLKQIVEEIDKKRKEQVLRRKPSTLSEKRASKLRSLRRTASLTW